MVSELSNDEAAARAMGLSYGNYKARMYNCSTIAPKKPGKGPQKAQKRKKKYDDARAFELWQEGKTDAEIASVFGVSRTIIQRWRDVLELPSTSKQKIDTRKYHLETDQDGVFVVRKQNTRK